MFSKKFLVITLLIFSIFAVQAHQGATGVVKERMDQMDLMKKQMNILRQMSKDKIPYEKERFKQNLNAMQQASSHMLMLFPEGSLLPPSEAKKAIWTQWNQFKEHSKVFTKRLNDLNTYVESDSRQALNKQLKLVGKSCLTCHKAFREKKKK